MKEKKKGIHKVNKDSIGVGLELENWKIAGKIPECAKEYVYGWRTTNLS